MLRRFFPRHRKWVSRGFQWWEWGPFCASEIFSEAQEGGFGGFKRWEMEAFLCFGDFFRSSGQTGLTSCILRIRIFILPGKTPSMYENFGFKSNIFNTKSLDLCKEDLAKFIGRVKDIKSFVVDISSTDGSVIIVTGHRGVGKSSFVNVMEYAISFDKKFLNRCINVNIPNLIPCYHKIQLETEDDVKNILLKTLSSLLFSIRQYASEKNISKKIPKKIKDLIQWVSEAVSITYSGQINIAGVGGGVSRSKQYKNISDLPTNVLEESIKQVVTLAMDFFKVQGIFLNINNVDVLEEKKFCEIFNQLRDYLFNIKGLWCVIIGQPGLYSSLFQQAARVTEIMSGSATLLDPLSEEDVIAVLKLRRKIYSQNPRKLSPLPVEEELIREIYKNSEGEIRQVLKACDDIMKAAFKENPNINLIKKQSGKMLLKDILEQQLSLHDLRAKDRQIIQEILKRGSFRPRDYKILKMKSAVDFTNRAKPLLKKIYLKKEVRGNTANYKAAGVIHLARYAGVQI